MTKSDIISILETDLKSITDSINEFDKDKTIVQSQLRDKPVPIKLEAYANYASLLASRAVVAKTLLRLGVWDEFFPIENLPVVSQPVEHKPASAPKKMTRYGAKKPVKKLSVVTPVDTKITDTPVSSVLKGNPKPDSIVAEKS